MSLGEIIKKERNYRNLKLHDVAADCGISESQLYRIENTGANISKPTLIKLANYFGHDLFPDVASLINKDIISIWQSVNADINSRDINKMETSLEIIKYVNDKSTNVILSSIAKQYYYLVEGLICLHQDEFLEARKFFIKGMESFNPYIDISTFNNIGSSSLQLRLLVGYAVTYKGEVDYEKNLYLLNKVFNNAGEKNESIYKKTIYNMANMYSFIENYNKSIDILDKYINSPLPKTRVLHDNFIYFKKATVSYRLGHDDYEKYALRALYSSILSKDINNGLLFLRVFNRLFDSPIMTKEKFLSL